MYSLSYNGCVKSNYFPRIQLSYILLLSRTFSDNSTAQSTKQNPDHPHTETNLFLNKRTSKGLVVLNKHYLIVNTIFCHSNLAMMKYHESKHLHLISCQPINKLDTPRGQNRFHLRVDLDMWGANMKGSNSTWGETFGYHL